MKRMDPTVRDLLTGGMIYGILAELIGLFVVKDRLGYSLGILIGYACLVFIVCHMYLTLDKALDMDSSRAVKYSIGCNILRFVIIAAVACLVAYIPRVNVIAMLIMLFGLKVSAFLQPTINRFVTSRLFKEGR